MNYIVDIIDTKDNTHVLSLEKAQRESIVLNYKGGDRADEMIIVGSSLDFSMIYQGVADGHYYDLFTGDETRFKVRLYDELNTTIWSGFLLPDSYREPYSHTQIVEFSATDGLGRLKGKFLPDDFYKDEKSVIQVITECLKLTGLSLDFRFAPAIENSKQKDYNLIYIDTLNLIEGDKKQDAYKVLNDLLESMLCSVYQAENSFNIEGINIRNLRVYTSKRYDADGVFIEEVTITRDRKEITGVATPNISMQAPYGVVEITHERELLNYDEAVYKEENDGWVTLNSRTSPETVNGIYPSAWFAINGAELSASDDGVNIPFTTPGTTDQAMITRQKLYVEKDQKYNLEIDFDYLIGTNGINDKDAQVLAINDGYYDNLFYFLVSILHIDENGVEQNKIVFWNDEIFSESTFYRRQRPDTEDFHHVQNLQFIADVSGVLQIKIGALPEFGLGYALIAFFGVSINKLTLEKIGQKEEEVNTNILNEDYTFKKELSLQYSDDNTGLSKSFILQKLRLNGDVNYINIDIIRQFEFQGFYYSVVSLRFANLIKDNPELLQQLFGGSIEVVDVIYNYNSSQEHVVKTKQFIVDALNFNLAVFDTLAVKEDRAYWEQWTDVFYKVEKKRYAECTLNVLNRSYDKPIPVIQDFTLKNNVKLNDFIIFPYLNKTEWILNNCKWNIDTGYSTVSCSQRYYVVREGEFLPPTVDAGPDLYFTGDSVNLTSLGFAPAGFIESYEWREVTNNRAKFTSPNSKDTLVYKLTGDYYEFEVKVTDNNGLTATDRVKIFRAQNSVVSFNLIYTNPAFSLGNEGFSEGLNNHYQVIVNPDISEGSALLLKGFISVDENSVDSTSHEYILEINGVQVDYYLFRANLSDRSFSINYNKGDVIVFKISTGAVYNTGSNSYSEIKATIDEVSFIQGIGTATGTPIVGNCRIQQS